VIDFAQLGIARMPEVFRDDLGFCPGPGRRPGRSEPWTGSEPARTLNPAGDAAPIPLDNPFVSANVGA